MNWAVTASATCYPGATRTHTRGRNRTSGVNGYKPYPITTWVLSLNRPLAVCALFIVLLSHYSVIVWTDTKPPGTFEVPLITAIAVGGERRFHEKKKPNYRFWTRTRNTGVKFLYVAITLTGISARAVIYIKERRFIEAKSWLPHGRINKNVIFIPLYIEYSSQILVGTLQNDLCHTIQENTRFLNCIHMTYLYTPQCFLLCHPQIEFLPYSTSIPHQKYTSCIRQKHCTEADY